MLQELLILGLVLLVAGLLLVVGTVLLMAVALLRPPRMSDGKAAALLRRISPGDLALRFEETRFAVRDEHTGRPLSIAAWWIPAAEPSGRCVVLVHGYADAKIGAIAWAPMLHALGWNVLAIDLRAHGESGGAYCTGGYFERHDLDQVLNQLRAARPRETQELALFGLSLGAAAALATAVLRDDLAALVLESPFIDFPTAARAHARLVGTPGGVIQSLALRVAEWISGADFAAVRPVDLLRRVRCPTLMIHAGEDAFVTQDQMHQMREALNSCAANRRCDHWRIDGALHLFGAVHTPLEYHRRLDAFLNAATSAESAPPPEAVRPTPD